MNSVITAFAAEGLIKEQKREEPRGVSAGLFGLTPATYRISSRILEEVVTTHLGLTIDETRQTIQRPGVCRHVVTLSPVQLRLAVAMCDAGEAGIMPSMVTSLRGGETTGERQLRTAFNRILSVLGVKLGRFAWKIVEK